VTFGAGVYTGIYVSQNYEVCKYIIWVKLFIIFDFMLQVPRVDDPKKLVERANEKFRELIDGKKK